MKTLDVLIVISFILIFLSLSLSVFYVTKHSNMVSAQINQGYLIVKVVDENGNPINKAKVAIIESKTSHLTDDNGQTEKISVPIKLTDRYDYLAPITFGEATIVVKASGYCPCIMYNVKITPGTTRTGVIIKLKTIINSEDSNILITRESPDEGFSQLIVEKL